MAFNQFPQKGGIPSGSTAGRPSGAVEGDTYYNGELGLLEIYSDGQWIPCSAPAGIPTIVGTDVGTSRAYGSGALTLTFTAGTNGGSPYGFSGTAVLGAITYTTGATTSTTATLIVGDSGTYSVSGTAYNGFGTSPASVPTNVAITTVPQAPTIGTATISSGNPVVNWTLNSTGGKNLSSITITPYLNGTTAQTSQTAATTSSTSYTFSSGQLTEDASYTFKVSATNANGTSLDSSASNSVTVDTVFSANYLVVAGGGSGGGNYQGGGGGAGGYRTSIGGTALTLSTLTNYTVTVGAGGASVNTSAAGNDGSNSVFSTITSTGGGGGGTNGINGRNGGSGGGAGATIPSPSSQPGSASPSGQGNNGGIGWDGASTCTLSGGGGGAGGVGGNSSQACNPGNGGAGGVGLENTITGSSVFYAGGGGGNTDSGTGTRGAGGNGGGGMGGKTNSSAGQPGTANTGGGGGGSSTNSPYNGSGAGGSGVVILRYPDTKTITIGAGLTGTTATVGSDKVTTITAGTGNVSW